MPTGINDLFKMSRMFYKEGQHLAIIGLPGSGKSELMQLSAIVNDVVILELNVPCFG
jgi:ABC-type polysaccharide/polyol phosphate transport system ATPase subunit